MNSSINIEGYNILAALIYVTETESEAVQRMFDWKPISIEGDEQQYYEAYVERDDKRLRIIAAQQDEMGMTAASTLSMKIIYNFRPKYLIMPGIAAGAEEEREDGEMFGDVVLATSIWNYSNGKYVSPHEAEIVFGEVGFIPRPSFIEIDEKLVSVFHRIIDMNETECHIHMGPLASGSTVVANKHFLDKQVRTNYQDTKGLDMESYGVAYAARHATEPRPMAIIAKSVCDFADERKDDRYQQFAAYTSCELVGYLVKEVLI